MAKKRKTKKVEQTEKIRKPYVNELDERGLALLKMVRAGRIPANRKNWAINTVEYLLERLRQHEESSNVAGAYLRSANAQVKELRWVISRQAIQQPAIPVCKDDDD